MGHGSACLCTFYRFWLRTFDMRFHLSGREVLDLFGAHAVVEVFSIFEGHRIIIFAVAFSFDERRNATLRRARRQFPKLVWHRDDTAYELQCLVGVLSLRRCRRRRGLCSA